MSYASRCEDCAHAAIQFGEYTGQRSYYRCRVSGWQTTAERQRHDGCGAEAKFFTAFVPLAGDEYREGDAR